MHICGSLGDTRTTFCICLLWGNPKCPPDTMGAQNIQAIQFWRKYRNWIRQSSFAYLMWALSVEYVRRIWNIPIKCMQRIIFDWKKQMQSNVWVTEWVNVAWMDNPVGGHLLTASSHGDWHYTGVMLILVIIAVSPVGIIYNVHNCHEIPSKTRDEKSIFSYFG